MAESPELTEEEWCELGKGATDIRDTIMELYIDLDWSVKKSNSKRKNLRKLHDLWLEVRCVLDDAVSAAFSMDVSKIGPNNTPITRVFYGGDGPEPSAEPPLKRAKKTAQPSLEQAERIQTLVQTIYDYMELVNQKDAVRLDRHIKPFVAVSKKLTKCLDALKN